MFPPAPFRRPFLLRVAAVWAFLRLAAMVGTGIAVESADTGPLGPLGLALLVDPVVVLVLFVDMSRRGEIVFLANLGYSFRRLTVGLVGFCFLLEAGLRGTLA